MNAILTPSHISVFHFARVCGLTNQTPSPDQLLLALEELRKVQGNALLIGGLAVGHYGWERVTHDIDILYAHADGTILTRLKKYFKLEIKAKSGWHKFAHKKTGVRLELIPEGGLTTFGFIPGPKTVGGEDGFISLFGLVWLKIVSGRLQDDADLANLCRVRLAEMEKIPERLPEEHLRARLIEIIAKAKREIENDPGLQAEREHKAQEEAAAYGKSVKAKKKRAKASARS